jgi:hypothetical protein
MFGSAAKHGHALSRLPAPCCPTSLAPCRCVSRGGALSCCRAVAGHLLALNYRHSVFEGFIEVHVRRPNRLGAQRQQQ